MLALVLLAFGLVATAEATSAPYLVLWDADTPAPIDSLENLGGEIDLCQYEGLNLNLEVVYSSSIELVEMTLTDAATDTEVVTQTEGVQPYMLGGDINEPFSVNALPALKVPGEYKLTANPTPGSSTAFTFTIKECQPPYLVLWDADASAPIDTMENLGGVIDLCEYEGMNLNMEVVYPSSIERVTLTMTDKDSGVEVEMRTEGELPYMLGGDINEPFSVNALPALKVPGEYKIRSNPKPGPSTKFDITIEACASAPTASPTMFPTLPVEEQDDLVTCISVIDENNSRNVDAQWAGFREIWPERPFCLLKPVPQNGLSLPSTFFDEPINIFEEVTRDSADATDTSDWYTLCDLEAGKSKGLTKVVLFIDNSGSMRTSSVINAFNLFQTQVAANGFEIVDAVYNGSEDYISPCELRSLSD